MDIGKGDWVQCIAWRGTNQDGVPRPDVPALSAGSVYSVERIKQTIVGPGLILHQIGESWAYNPKNFTPLGGHLKMAPPRRAKEPA